MKSAPSPPASSSLLPENPKSRSLADWFNENQCIGSGNMQKDFQQRTFRDHGVLRYKNSWLPAPEEGCPYLLPGSCEFSLPSQVVVGIGGGATATATATTSTTNTAAAVTTVQQKASVKLLFDWQLLWHYLVNDKYDELAIHDALLRVSINFYMQKKTMYVYWILYIYTQIVIPITFTGLSHGDIRSIIPDCLEGFFIGILYYWYIQRLYMGNDSITKQPTGDSSSPHDETTSLINHDNRLTDNRSPAYMHYWCGSLRQFIHTTFVEGRTLLQQNSLKVIDSEQTSLSFNQLMNIALKFLHIHCEINPHELDRSRKTYKMAFLCLFTSILIATVALFVASWEEVITVCRVEPQNCNLAIIFLVLNAGFLLNAALDFILYGVVVIGVIGLSYGSILAYFMASSWMKRYAGLRRIEGQTTVLITPATGDTTTTALSNNNVVITPYLLELIQ